MKTLEVPGITTAQSPPVRSEDRIHNGQTGRAGLVPYDRRNVPVFMGAGAVSVNELEVAVLFPKRDKPVPEAEIQVVPPEVRIVPLATSVAPPLTGWK